MRLLSLEVENYRNIASASLTPGRELTVICGNNGQGKTNLLEAIWLLTGGKSFRGGRDAELVRRGEPFAVLKRPPSAHSRKSRKGRAEPRPPDGGRAGFPPPGPDSLGERGRSQAGGQPCGQFSGGGLRPRTPESREGRAGRAAEISGRGPLPALPRLPDPLPPLCPGFAAEKRAASTLFQWH